MYGIITSAITLLILGLIWAIYGIGAALMALFLVFIIFIATAQATIDEMGQK